jgi:hypothetical protein
MTEVYIEEVGSKWPLPEGQPPVRVTESSVSFGGVTLEKGNHQSNENLLLLRSAYKSLHSLAICVQQKWLSILVRSLAKKIIFQGSKYLRDFSDSHISLKPVSAKR